MSFALLLFALLLQAPAAPADRAACEQRALRVLSELKPDNDLRRALARGGRGDCVRRPWMDEMRRLGIRQASFLVGYTVTKEKVSLKVGRPQLLRAYYSGDGADLVRDPKLLREVRRVGLERRLREAVEERLRRDWGAQAQREVRRTGDEGRGQLQATLLDDEALPVIDYIF